MEQRSVDPCRVATGLQKTLLQVNVDEEMPHNPLITRVQKISARQSHFSARMSCQSTEGFKRPLQRWKLQLPASASTSWPANPAPRIILHLWEHKCLGFAIFDFSGQRARIFHRPLQCPKLHSCLVCLQTQELRCSSSVDRLWFAETRSLPCRFVLYHMNRQRKSNRQCCWSNAATEVAISLGLQRPTL